MDCRPPVSSDHGVSQTRILEWIAISSQPRDWTCVSFMGREDLHHWATRAINSGINDDLTDGGSLLERQPTFAQLSVTKPNWVFLPSFNRAKLPTLGCGIRKCSVYCRRHTRNLDTSCSTKPKFFHEFQESIFKGKVREESQRVCVQLMYSFLSGWWWGNRVALQDLTL